MSQNGLVLSHSAMTAINNVNIYSGPDPEDVVLCPFDKTHLIRHKRVPYHLIQCRRQYKGDEMIQCPFNARHWVLVNQYPFHVACCTDRYQIEQDVAMAKQPRKKIVSVCENRYAMGCRGRLVVQTGSI